jgi:hypothetical protein
MIAQWAPPFEEQGKRARNTKAHLASLRSYTHLSESLIADHHNWMRVVVEYGKHVVQKVQCEN